MEITSTRETSQLINGSIRSDPNSPYPTTFVTADSSSFKQVVQLLTGSELPSPNPSSSSRSFSIPPVKASPAGKKHQQQGFKLYERRMKSSHHLHLPNLQDSTFNRPGPAEILSPSVLDFPSLTLISPVAPRDAEPQLLPLFPVTSPRVSDPTE